MRALAMGMNLGEHYFDDKVDQRAHNLRLLNYPPVARKLIESGGNRAGAHSDYGTVTLLFQDMVGGLEVQDRRGNFVPVTPVANSVVANLGDLLQRWSNGLLKSTVHRVVLPYGGNKSPITPQRNSIAFFSNPNLHQVIEVSPRRRCRSSADKRLIVSSSRSAYRALALPSSSRYSVKRI